MTASPGNRIAVVIGAKISVTARNRLPDDTLTGKRNAEISAEVVISAAYNRLIEAKQYANIFGAQVAIFAGGVIITRLATENGNSRANRAVANIIGCVNVGVIAGGAIGQRRKGAVAAAGVTGVIGALVVVSAFR